MTESAESAESAERRDNTLFLSKYREILQIGCHAGRKVHKVFDRNKNRKPAKYPIKNNCIDVDTHGRVLPSYTFRSLNI
jgi:hypothetical protein